MKMKQPFAFLQERANLSSMKCPSGNPGPQRKGKKRDPGNVVGIGFSKCFCLFEGRRSFGE